MGIIRELKDMKSYFEQPKEEGFYFDRIGQYFDRKKRKEDQQVIGDKTCNDLDFEELFMFLDRTASKVGQQYFYNKLRTIPSSTSHFKESEDRIKALTEKEELRKRTHKQLSKLKKSEAYNISTLFQEEHEEKPKWFTVIQLLSFSSLLLIILMPFNGRLILPFLAVVISNMVIHYWNKKNVYRYLSSVPQLLRLRKVAGKLYKEKEFQSINPNIKSAFKSLDTVRRKMSFFRLEASMQGDFEALFWMFIELFKILFLLEPLFLFSILKRLDTKREEIEEVFQFVGEVDSTMSIASLRQDLEHYCTPELTENNTNLECRNIYHPLIENCITNNLKLNGKSILLTGSNMSGKTTFIRTIGLNMITGMTINTCFADFFTFPIANIQSAIRISDDLMNDKSYYFEEVSTIKGMIESSAKPQTNIFFLDELYKGTNTVERIAAGKAVLSSLSKGNNIVFVSTHDIELTDMLAGEYELYHFSEIVEDNNISFDYKLKEGKLKHRNAIRILQINDYPEEIITEAIAISKELDESIGGK